MPRGATAQIDFLGPPFDAGPLPAVVYFALSAHDSLHLDPYHQPARFLQSALLRIFSFTLPGHDRLAPTEALQWWAKEIQQGRNVVKAFVQETAHTLRHLIHHQVINPAKIATMGLSRGAFIAAHLAAEMPEISTLLGFAPLTRLGYTKEFEEMKADQWDLIHLSDQLYNRTVRCYIGNRDTRVGTAACFEWISNLAEVAYQRHLSTSPIELIIRSSIGHQGHGTSPAIFQQGAAWLSSRLGIV